MPTSPRASNLSPNESPVVPYLRAIRAHKLLIAMTVLIAIAAALAIASSRTSSYQATAQILVTPLPEGGGNGSYTGLPILTSSAAEPTRTLETAASMLQSPQAYIQTAAKFRGGTVSGVRSAISVEPKGESNIITVTATQRSAALAASLANRYVESTLALRSTELKRDATTLITQLQARESALPASDTTTLSQLAAQVTSLVPIADGHDPNFSQLQLATPPTAPSGSGKALILVLAILAGLVLGIAGAVIAEFTDRRVRDEDEALTIYPLPVLARVPRVPAATASGTSIDMVAPPVREALRTLQVQLTSDGDKRGRTVMMTSASTGDGKTSSAINLALVLAAADRKVILFDFDLRKPDIGRRLGIHSELMDVFRPGATLESVLVESPATPGLSVVSTDGRGERDVTPLLEAVSRRLPTLLAEAATLADYVIIDTAPLGHVSDALRAAGAVDDIVLVVHPGRTERIDLEHTRELLERLGYTPSGMLVIGQISREAIYGSYLEPDPPRPPGPVASRGTPEEGQRERDGAKQGGSSSHAKRASRERARQSAGLLGP
jgi:Mrp family chromosome partitioning ATPase